MLTPCKPEVLPSAIMPQTFSPFSLFISMKQTHDCRQNVRYCDDGGGGWKEASVGGVCW